MLKKIISFIITADISDEKYKTVKDDMYRNNLIMLRVLSAIATTIFLVCISMGMMVPNMGSKMPMYVAGGGIAITICCASFFSHSKKLHTFCMFLLDFMLLSTGLLITLLGAPEQLTVTLIPVALLVPLFFDVKPIVFIVVVGCADLIYISIAPFVKPSEILTLDMVDVLAFSIAGIMIGTVITKVKVERYIYANRIKKVALRDGLTDCYNRMAYSEDVASMPVGYPSDFVYVSIDVNGLKMVNDSKGHEAGDEIIIGASQCMQKCLGKYGKVYRTGGDEFTAILYIGKNDIAAIMEEFEKEVNEWHGKQVDSISVSVGYVKAKEAQGCSISTVASLADSKMYEAKTEFYKKKGLDRRGQAAAHTALCKLYTKILKINLTDDTYGIINMDIGEQTSELGFSDTISKWLKNFGTSGHVHPEDMDEYLKYTNIQYMRDYFMQDKTSLHIFYRRKYGEEFKQVMMEIIPAEDYSNTNQSMYLYVKDIDK